MESAKELARDARSERRRILGLSVPAATIIAVIVFLPTLWLFGLSFFEGEAFSFSHYQRMIDSPAYFKIFLQTFEISVVVTVLALLLGYPLAYLMSQLRAWPSRGTAQAGAQLHRNGDRIVAYHVAIPDLANLQRAQKHRSDLSARRRELGGHFGARFLDHILPAFDAGRHGRITTGVCPVPRVLRHARAARRWQGNNGVDADPAERGALFRLGCGKRAWRCPASGDGFAVFGDWPRAPD